MSVAVLYFGIYESSSIARSLAVNPAVNAVASISIFLSASFLPIAEPPKKFTCYFFKYTF